MKIVYFEMRKSWLKISTLIVLIICAALDIYRIGNASRYYVSTYGDFHEPYFRLYDTVCGDLDENRLAPFRERLNELAELVAGGTFSTEYAPEKYIYTGYTYGDYSLFSGIAEEITYCATYGNASNEIASKAAEAYHFYKSTGNNYEMKKNALIYQLYQNRNIPEYRATNWAGQYFSYDFSSLLCVVMLVLGLASSLTNEKASGMNSLMTAYGKSRKSLLAKIISTAVYCAGLTIFFTGFDIVFCNYFLGIRGVDMPIYSAPIFQNSPFGFSFLSAFFICAEMRFLGMFSIALLILLISKISPNTVVSTITSFAAFFVLIFLSLISDNVINPIGLLTPKTYIREFGTINLFGEPVLLLYAAVLAGVFLCAAEISNMKG